MMTTAHNGSRDYRLVLYWLLVLNCVAAAARAQTEVRPYPDPGHRWLGVYAGGPEHRLGSDLEVLSEFSELVKAQAGSLVADLHRAIETRDVKLLRRSAHTLKGSVIYIGAEPLAQAAQALEILGRTESFDNSTELLATLEQELVRVLTALDAGPPDSR